MVVNFSRLFYSRRDCRIGQYMVISPRFLNQTNVHRYSLSKSRRRAITRNPDLFPNPEQFDPERYVPMFDKSVRHDPKDFPLDTESFAYGFGRR